MSDDKKQEKPPERYWPFDGLGNVIRKEKTVVLSNNNMPIICRVLDVQTAGYVATPDGKAMPMNGHVTIAIQIPFGPKSGIAQLLVLETPETQAIKLC
jgi:hypothetical protein